MKRIAVRVGIVHVVALGLALVQSVSAQVPMRTWEITVQVTPTKANGSAWDVLGGAPDIALCGSSAGGAGCVLAEDAVARCQDSFSCAFSVSLPETFSATVWDLDVASDDLIGTCFIDRPGTYSCGRATVTAR